MPRSIIAAIDTYPAVGSTKPDHLVVLSGLQPKLGLVVFCCACQASCHRSARCSDGSAQPGIIACQRDENRVGKRAVVGVAVSVQELGVGEVYSPGVDVCPQVIAITAIADPACRSIAVLVHITRCAIRDGTRPSLGTFVTIVTTNAVFAGADIRTVTLSKLPAGVYRADALTVGAALVVKGAQVDIVTSQPNAYGPLIPGGARGAHQASGIAQRSRNGALGYTLRIDETTARSANNNTFTKGATIYGTVNAIIAEVTIIWHFDTMPLNTGDIRTSGAVFGEVSTAC
jgi:hypothetical protein